MFENEPELLALLAEDLGQRSSRIRALSNEKLVYYFRLLSDSRVIRNVPSLELFEAELRARHLPDGRSH